MTKRTILTGILATLALLVITSVGVWGRYGGGEPYRDLGTTPLHSESALVEAARYDEPIGNIAVSATGRLFFTVHPESRPETHKLLEWRDGAAHPYPSAKVQERFDTVLGLAIDQRGLLWTIDHGNHGTRTARLLAIDLATDTIVAEHAFSPEVAPAGSFLQDLNISPDGRWAYIADVSFWCRAPGLVIVDLEEGRERRVLTGHASVMPMDYVIDNPIKRMEFFGGLVALKAGVDGIAVSTDGKQLAFAAMNHDKLYQVSTAALQDFSLDDDAIAKELVVVGDKPLNDGLSMDREGNVLVTDVEHGSVVRITPSGELTTLIASERICWADALSHGPGNSVYIADSAIPHQMLQSKEHIAEHAPYFIWRFESDKPGVAGQ